MLRGPRHRRSSPDWYGYQSQDVGIGRLSHQHRRGVAFGKLQLPPKPGKASSKTRRIPRRYGALTFSSGSRHLLEVSALGDHLELADRWAKICGDLVAMSRLPNARPYSYVGTYQIAAFNTAFLTSSDVARHGPCTSVSDPPG